MAWGTAVSGRSRAGRQPHRPMRRLPPQIRMRRREATATGTRPRTRRDPFARLSMMARLASPGSLRFSAHTLPGIGWRLRARRWRDGGDGQSAEDREKARAAADDARRAAFRDRGSRYHISSPGIKYDYEWLRRWADEPRLLASINTIRLRRPPKCARREYYHMVYHARSGSKASTARARVRTFRLPGLRYPGTMPSMPCPAPSSVRTRLSYSSTCRARRSMGRGHGYRVRLRSTSPGRVPAAHNFSLADFLGFVHAPAVLEAPDHRWRMPVHERI